MTGYGIVVYDEERRHLCDPEPDVLEQHQARLGRDVARDEQVQVVEPQGEGSLGPERADRNASGAAVVARDHVPASRRSSRPLSGRCPRPRNPSHPARSRPADWVIWGAPAARLGRDAGDVEDGVASGLLVCRREDGPVAVGVLQMGVDPRLGRQVSRIDLSHADDERGQGAVDAVTVEREAGDGEAGAVLLELLVGLRGDRGLPEGKVVQSRGGSCDHPAREVRDTRRRPAR